MERYRNGTVPPRFQSGRDDPLEYGDGRRPVRCGHRADIDIRDGLCYPTGTVPRQYQEGRPGYHYRRNGYFECGSAATLNICSPISRYPIAPLQRFDFRYLKCVHRLFRACFDIFAWTQQHPLDRDRITRQRVVETPAAFGLIGEGP